ncbi:hypothetical protein G9A89_001368 [Geosiphon pyriformis]|nr:hypothetical protein G9A89_001368 [Geosiphon pyriformis]
MGNIHSLRTNFHDRHSIPHSLLSLHSHNKKRPYNRKQHSKKTPLSSINPNPNPNTSPSSFSTCSFNSINGDYHQYLNSKHKFRKNNCSKNPPHINYYSINEIEAELNDHNDEFEPKTTSSIPRKLLTDQTQYSHYLDQSIWHNQFSAPVQDSLLSGARCLEAGCGTGQWLLDMAQAYPMSEFIGCDLLGSSFHTSTNSGYIPRNAKFLKANILDGLPFENDSFEFIRISMFFTTLTEAEWLTVIKELTRVLCPGGWLELMEPNFGLYNMGPSTKLLVTGLLQFFIHRGINPEIARKFELILAVSNGLSNTHQSIRHISVGPRGGETGLLFQDMLGVYFHQVHYTDISEFLGLENEEEYKALWRTCEREFREFETGCRMYRVWSQKV